MNAAHAGATWRGRRLLGRVALAGACVFALAVWVRPAHAGVDVFIGATFGIPVTVYPAYAQPAYYYAAPPANCGTYGPRWRHPHHGRKHHHKWREGHGRRGYYR